MTFSDAELQLPFDSFPVPGRAARFARHDFALALPGGLTLSQPLVTGLIVAMLARYSGQEQVPFSCFALTGNPAEPPDTELQSAAQLEAALQPPAPQLRATRWQFAISGRTTLRNLTTVAQGSGPEAHSGRVDAAALVWIEDAAAEFEPGSVPHLTGAVLNWVFRPHALGARVTLVFDSGLFTLQSIARFAGHLRTLANTLPAGLDLPLPEIPLLTAREQQWLDEQGTGNSALFPQQLPHRLFEACAQRTPSAIAVRFEQQALDYATLNLRANQLAHALMARGVGPGKRVMVCLEPSLDIAVTLLAIFKSGAVYVPLDPTYPEARIAVLLADTQPTLLIARDALIRRLGLNHSRPFSLDEHELQTSALPGDNPLRTPAATDIAYIYYTSGTTGQPKGALASYANLAHYLGVARDRYRFSAADVMPAVARFSFSISMFELMSPLAAGGRLVVLARDHVLDVGRLADTLASVTFFHIGPSLLKHVIAHIRRHAPDFRAYAGVRHASSGGDMVSAEIVQSLQQIFSRAEVYVIYGCTEVSCMGCTWEAPRGQELPKSYVGRPFENVSVQILDADMNRVPAGVVGEIWFSGAGIVSGYVNRPDLTDERFVDVNGVRCYRTGDRGRWSDDGNIEILGRSDFQIQLRGMRIELGEIEYHLRRAPGVKEGVVAERDNAQNERALVAYVVPEPPLRKKVIRQYLRENLPDYMVPSVIVELARLPLNHNMKLDRRALPAPAADDHGFTVSRQMDARFRAPATETEIKLAALWNKLLDVGYIGLDDHFFDLGGSSLLAMELIIEVREKFGVLLDGMDVLRESLAVQAALCDRRSGAVAREESQPARAATQRPVVEPAEIFHFGSGQHLYGVMYGDSGDPVTQAVLICPSLGQEVVRTQFIVRRLAERLASQGVPSMRFDFSGQGESLGDPVSLDVWAQDLIAARAELLRRTGAKQITVLAIRFGALVLARARARMTNDLTTDPVVLWEPVYDGGAYLHEMLGMHREYLRFARNRHLWTRALRTPRGVDLLGSLYPEPLIREIQQTAITPAQSFASASTVPINMNYGWNEIARLEQALPDPGISLRLHNSIVEPR